MGVPRRLSSRPLGNLRKILFIEKMEKVSLVTIYFSGLLFAEILRLPHRIHRYRYRHLWVEAKHSTRNAEGIVLLFVLLGVWILPSIYSFSSWFHMFDYSLPPWQIMIALILFILGLIIRFIAQQTLSRSWSFTLETSETHKLVRNGIYSITRHPIYLSLIFWAIAQPVLLQNYIAGFGGAVAVILIWLIRVPREEELLLERFGDEYRDYMVQTGRLFTKKRFIQ
jgi:protein-S-isoprenylcysteine O-methyltransferase Ste14